MIKFPSYFFLRYATDETLLERAIATTETKMFGTGVCRFLGCRFSWMSFFIVVV
jgi:hypothetical protein